MRAFRWLDRLTLRLFLAQGADVATFLGFYLLVAMGLRSPLGRAWSALTGHGLAFTFEGLVIASVLYSLPFVVQPIAAAFAQVDRTLLEASATLGASPWRTFTHVTIPIARAGIFAGAVLGFAHTLGELARFLGREVAR